MGDFNFHSGWKAEQSVIEKSPFEDIFLALNDGKEEDTMSPTPRFSGWRPDKILVNKES